MLRSNLLWAFVAEKTTKKNNVPIYECIYIPIYLYKKHKYIKSMHQYLSTYRLSINVSDLFIFNYQKHS